MFLFLRKRTFRFPPLESQDQVISSRKLSTLACFAFQRYFGNLTNECSFTYSFSSVKCKFCWNWLPSGSKPHEKTKCSLNLQKTVLLTVCHFFWINQTSSWRSKWRKILSLAKSFSRDVGITWPKIFIQNNCGSNKYLVGGKGPLHSNTFTQHSI